MKHLIITGGAGFIGSHLCEALLKRGYAVTAIDNFVTGREENLKTFKNHADFFFLKQDICNPLSEKEIPFMSRYGLHGVLHFACPASPIDFDKIPLEILKVDSIGTINTVELAMKFQARYLLASTSEVYGDPLVHPQKETYWGNVNPIGPRSVYDEAKRFSEAAVMAYHRYHHVNTHLVRIFNTYGPRLQINDGRVISNLMTQALRGEALTIYGDGMQTRSFCYVSDLIAGILALADSNEHLPVNIGNPEEWTILSCAEEILKLIGSDKKIVFKPLPQDDPTRRRPDISKAIRLLGWTPKIQLRQGLEMSLAYFRANAEIGLVQNS